MAMMENRNIILFDGVCNLCSGIVAFLIKRDRKTLFRFAALQSETGRKLKKIYASGNEENDTIYYIRGNECFQKSTAILYILKDLGRGWQCFYPLVILPVCMRDAVYLFISLNRYRLFGKRKSCLMPDSDTKERFI